MSSGISPSDIDELIDSGVDLYALLDLPKYSLASDKIVRKNFRKKALIYHPDKNPGADARAKFELISKALEVLISHELKGLYDEKLKVLDQQRLKNEQLSKNLQDLRLNLKKNEQRHHEAVLSNKRRLLKLDMLREEGIKMCKIKEQELRARKESKKGVQSSSIFNRDYELKFVSTPPLLKVKWKLRPDVPDMVESGAIENLMEIFGQVADINKYSSSDSRYQYCLVQYKDFDAFSRALKHDYSKTSDIWDEVGLRRVSSLLRSAEIYNDKSDGGGEVEYFEDYFDRVVSKMRARAKV